MHNVGRLAGILKWYFSIDSLFVPFLLSLEKMLKNASKTKRLCMFTVDVFAKKLIIKFVRANRLLPWLARKRSAAEKARERAVGQSGAAV